MWLVQAGTLELFAVPVKDGTPAGTRRYVGSIGPGAALFGATLDAAEPSFGLLAVPCGDTRLLQLSRQAFRQHIAPITAVALAEGWITQLDAILPRDTPTLSHRQATVAQKYTLCQGERLQPELRTILWLHLQHGSVN